MKGFVDIRSAAVGFLLAGVVCLILGAAGLGSGEVAGRFQIACTDSLCYEVDTVTGQVWSSQDADFKRPKIRSRAKIKAAAASGFAGMWRTTVGQAEEITIRIEDGGIVVAADVEEGRQYAGTWRMDGERAVITLEGDEVLLAEMGTDGRMVLWEEGQDERLLFEQIDH